MLSKKKKLAMKFHFGRYIMFLEKEVFGHITDIMPPQMKILNTSMFDFLVMFVKRWSSRILYTQIYSCYLSLFLEKNKNNKL